MSHFIFPCVVHSLFTSMFVESTVSLGKASLSIFCRCTAISFVLQPLLAAGQSHNAAGRGPILDFARWQISLRSLSSWRASRPANECCLILDNRFETEFARDQSPCQSDRSVPRIP